MLTEQILATNKKNRLALVIGNSNYTAPNSRLANPVNDANAIRAALEPFVTIDRNSANDLPGSKLYSTFKAFAQDLEDQQADIAIVYYSGHGLQVGQDDYLLQTDLPTPWSTNDLKNALSINQMITLLADHGALAQIYIVDACRTNSFVKSTATAEVPVYPSISVASRAFPGTPPTGLTSEFPQSTKPGVFIAFATAPGDTASDGAGTHGAYTTYLLPEITKPEPAQQVFDTVHDLVVANIQNQSPWTNKAMGNLAIYIHREVTAHDYEYGAWLLTQQSGNPVQMQDFIDGARRRGFSEFLPEAEALLREVCKNPLTNCAEALSPNPPVVVASAPAVASPPAAFYSPPPPAGAGTGAPVSLADELRPLVAYAPQVASRVTVAANAPSVIFRLPQSLTNKPTHVFATNAFHDLVASIPSSEPLTILQRSGEQSLRALLAGREIGFVKAGDLPNAGKPPTVSIPLGFKPGTVNLTADSLVVYAGFVGELLTQHVESISIVTSGDGDTPYSDNTTLGLVRAEAVRKSILASWPEALRGAVQFHLSNRDAQDPDKTGQITAVLAQ